MASTSKHTSSLKRSKASRRSTCSSRREIQSPEYTTEYSDGSKSDQKTKASKGTKEFKREYVSTEKDSWTAYLDSVFLQFDIKHATEKRIGSDYSQDDNLPPLCVMETGENKLKLYDKMLIWKYFTTMGLDNISMNEAATSSQARTDDPGVGGRPGGASTLHMSSSSDEEAITFRIIPGSDYHKSIIREMAMDHLLKCLKQGETNEQFIKENFGYLSSTSQSSMEADETTAKKRKYFVSEETNFIPIEDKANDIVTEKDVKWIIKEEECWIYYKGRKITGFSSKPIDPRDCPFLHPALVSLEPKKPSEPFVYFGIAIRCVELKDIFVLDGSNKTFKTDIEIDPGVCDIISFLRGINDKSKQAKDATFMEHFFASLEQYIKEYEAVWTNRIQQLTKKNGQVASNLFGFLKKWLCIRPAGCNNKLALQTFAAKILALVGPTDDNVSPKPLDIFKKQQFQGPICIPDIEWEDSLGLNCWPIVIEVEAKLWYLEMSNVVDEHGNVDLVSLRCATAWQVFEQLLATILERDDARDAAVVYQGGLLLTDGKIRTTVLSVTNEEYKEFKKLNEIGNVKKTLEYIKASKKAWCKFYIEKDAYPFWDILKRAKITYYNFY